MRKSIILKRKETLIELEKRENISAVHLGFGCGIKGKASRMGCLRVGF